MSNNLPVVAEKLHATLGASVAARWMACPGSVRLSEEVPATEGESNQTSFAREGTAAHALAENCLRLKEDPQSFVGSEIEGVEVTEEMAAHVAVFVDYCKTLLTDDLLDGEYWIEKPINLAPLNPPLPMFGTPDFVAYQRTQRTLHVVDLKYGQGVVVEVKGNKQTRYYALGSILNLDQSYPIEKVVVTIVQPRVFHPDGVIRSEELEYMDILEFSGELLEAARKTQEPDAPLNPGSHCRFCPASGICPAQRSRALAVAQTEFEIVEAEPEFVPPAPSTIPDEQFFNMLGKLDVLDDWIGAMRARAYARMLQGEEIPGFKLVAKRATRKWTDTPKVEQILIKESDVIPEEIYEPRDLRSPAQIEKLIGKKQFATLLAEHVEKKSSGHTMVPSFDPRPALSLGAGHEFAALPAGEPSNTEGNEEESYR